MADSTVQISFGSWLRRGLAAGISRPDEGPSQPPKPTTKVAIGLEFDGNAPLAQPSLTLVGPGDIAGLDTRVIVRTFPPADVNDAEAAFFVVVELDQADLLWRYTPARATGESDPSEGTPDDKLRSWVTLVVLEETEIVALKPATATQKLAILTAPVNKLPGLDEAWAWGHTQERSDFYPRFVAASLGASRGSSSPRSRFCSLAVPPRPSGRQSNSSVISPCKAP
jgi:hypothetical protein